MRSHAQTITAVYKTADPGLTASTATVSPQQSVVHRFSPPANGQDPIAAAGGIDDILPAGALAVAFEAQDNVQSHYLLDDD